MNKTKIKNRPVKEEDVDGVMEIALPASIGSCANLKLPDPYLRDHYIDEKDRIIRIYDDIDDSTMDVVDRILRYNKEDRGIPKEKRKPIRILINTYGGDGRVCDVIMNTILLSKTPVWTINMCKAYSSGALILLCGHKRFALKGSHVVIHKGSVSLKGEVSIVESAQRSNKKLDKQIEDIIFSRTSISKEFYMKKASSDIYYEAEECVKYKVVNKVVEDLDEILFDEVA